MSLINQALKQEQRRRSPELAAAASLRMGRASRGGNDKALTLIVGFAVVGLILAGAAAAFIYFGARFIDGIEFADKDAPPAERAAAPAAETPATAAAASDSPAPGLAAPAPLEGLTSADLEKLRHLLEAAQPGAANAASARASDALPVENPDLRAANQAIVDALQIQGFRKAGQNSRAFLNGKLYKIGDVVDQASGLFIAGYTDSTLVFEDPLGYRYERVL